MLSMKTAAGLSFTPIDKRYRVGFITINPGNPVSSNEYLKLAPGETARAAIPTESGFAETAQALFDAFVIGTRPLIAAHPARVSREATFLAKLVHDTLPPEAVNAVLRRAMIEPDYAAMLLTRVTEKNVEPLGRRLVTGWVRRTPPITAEREGD